MAVALGLISIVSVAYMVYQGASLAVLDHERTGRLAIAAAIAVVVLVAAAAWLSDPAGIVGSGLAKAVAYVVLMAVTVVVRADPDTSPVRPAALGRGCRRRGALRGRSPPAQHRNGRARPPRARRGPGRGRGWPLAPRDPAQLRG